MAHLDEALGEVIEIANQYAKRFRQYSLLPIYVRFVKTDDLYLSPANSKCAVDGSNNDHACYIEVQMLNKPKMIMVATTIKETMMITVAVTLTVTVTVTVRAIVLITITTTLTVTLTVTVTVTVRAMVLITITIMITVHVTQFVRPGSRI